jgi:hypothetical protein
VAHEFGLDRRAAATAAEDLLTVDVIRRDGDALHIRGAEPAAPGGLRLQDFLALADDLADQRHRRARTAQLLRPAGLVLTAAALVAAVLLVPVPGRGPSTPVASTARTIAADGSSPDRGPSAPTGTTLPTSSTAGPTTKAPTATPGPTLSCPPGGPVLEVLSQAPDLAGNLAVAGVARNPTALPLTIRSFTVHASAAGQDLVAPGRMDTAVVPPHGAVTWSARFADTAVPSRTELQAVLGDWGWQGPDIPPGCPGR